MNCLIQIESEKRWRAYKDETLFMVSNSVYFYTKYNDLGIGTVMS